MKKKQNGIIAIVVVVIIAIILAALAIFSSHKNNNKKEYDKVVPQSTTTAETTVKETTPETTVIETTTAETTSVVTTKKQSNELKYMIDVNKTQNIVIIYTKDENGEYTKPYKAMVCSVGLDNGTPSGTFQTKAKHRWLSLFGDVFGQYTTKINGHYWFHSVPYFTKDSSDLEYEEYNKLGEDASMGCIRLTVEDAKWIYDNCPIGTTVRIYESDEKEPLEKPVPQKIDPESPNRGWDPTDSDPKNPWKQQ